jgi:Fic family protein
MEADILTDKPAEDRGESVSRMDPMLIGADAQQRPALVDLAFELAQRSAAFRSSLPTSLLPPLATLVRAMNCYYSNLIEGHNTHPIDIERALRNEYSLNPEKRDLQIEAKAHIAVQEWIDAANLENPPASRAALRELHRRFCELLPEDLLWVEDPDSGERERLVPGMLRRRDVKVGQHIAISPGAVPRFLDRFEEVYTGLGKSESVLAVAAAHHRLLWIHPFMVGNGRVARLMSHAMLLRLLDTGAVWSIARGLARRVNEYKSLLAACDRERRNHLDGRGHLSEEALAAFTRFFLEVCLDQVAFMQSLTQPEFLSTRIQMWAEEEMRLGLIPAKSDTILRAILYRGELPRGEALLATGTGERQSRRIVAALLARGVLQSPSPRAPLRLTFPAALAHRWMPGLFPEKTS